jgi:hypothetical protein
LVYDQKGMMKIAVDFYKNLFAKESGAHVKLGPYFWDDHDKVAEEENRILVALSLNLKLRMPSLVVILKELLGQMAYLFYSIRNFGIWLRKI